MEIIESVLPITRSARIFSTGISPHLAQKVWIVLHGYGHSASFFLRKMEALLDENTAILAPEGLSKFYIQGLSGRVGASWMTKEARELEIEDQLNYMDSLLEKYQWNTETEINILGFSQGASVASRWFLNRDVKVNNFVIWGAGVPTETTAEMAQKWNKCNCIFMLGEEDEFLKPEVLTTHFSQLDELHFKHKRVFYAGGHKVELAHVMQLKSHLL